MGNKPHTPCFVCAVYDLIWDRYKISFEVFCDDESSTLAVTVTDSAGQGRLVFVDQLNLLKVLEAIKNPSPFATVNSLSGSIVLQSRYAGCFGQVIQLGFRNFDFYDPLLIADGERGTQFRDLVYGAVAHSCHSNIPDGKEVPDAVMPGQPSLDDLEPPESLVCL